jgi:hypothetical protein
MTRCEAITVLSWLESILTTSRSRRNSIDVSWVKNAVQSKVCSRFVCSIRISKRIYLGLSDLIYNAVCHHHRLFFLLLSFYDEVRGIRRRLLTGAFIALAPFTLR